MKTRFPLVASSIFAIFFLFASLPETSVLAQDEPKKEKIEEKETPETKPDEKSLQALEDLKAANQFLSKNENEKAIHSLRRAVKKLPDNAGLRQRLAKVYFRDGKLTEAVSEMEVAVKLKPTVGVYQAELAWLYTKANRLAGAMRHAKIASQIISDSASPYVILGYCYASSDKNKLAVESLTKALELEPKNLTACLYLAEIYLEEGESKRSIEMYERARTIDKDNLSILLGLASAYGELNNNDKAREFYESAIKLYPKDSEALGRYGWFLSQTGDMAGALKYGMKANEIRVYQSWDQFMGMFISVWAGIFIVFGLIFAAIALGAKFKPQPGEDLLRSFFLIMHKEKPGRLVFTSRRVVFVPELISRSFGATRISIERDQISKIDLVKTDSKCTLKIATAGDTEHVFKIPIMIFEPLNKLLQTEGLVSGEGADSGEGKSGKNSGDSKKEDQAKKSEDADQDDEDKVVATRLDFRPEDDEKDEPEAKEEKEEDK